MEENLISDTIPVGTVYYTINNINPKDILKFGEWKPLNSISTLWLRIK